jgi:PDZ domain
MKGIAFVIIGLVASVTQSGCGPAMVRAENKAKEQCAKQGLEPFIYDRESTNNAFTPNTATIKLHCIDPNDIVHTSAAVGIDLLRSNSIRGALVLQVTAETIGAKGGLAVDDVVYQFGPNPVTTVDDLMSAISSTNPGEEVEIRIHRGKQDLTTTAKF